ncbi:DUF6578 domain-containing protein [Streptomyces sp. NPDC057654]|uniref:DUF6578 domain-containing protein n=1 Tax=Streptomyces sp. NPDC057654 TaxID=3346196 RepID=UPI00368B8FE3
MVLWKVFYADWEMECCGTPFPVGAEVRWTLLLTEDADDTWQDCRCEVEGPVESRGGTAAIIRDGALTALWSEPPWPLPGRARVTGRLSVHGHGPSPEEVAPTVGLVRRIQVVTQGFAEPRTGSRSFAPVPGERWLREVDMCPKWFRREVDGPERMRSGVGYRRDETGVLVEVGTADW